MVNLTNKILEILNGMTGIQTVIYDNGHSANVRIDRRPTPAALLYTLPDWTLDISRGTAKEKADIQVFFFERVDFDLKAEEKLETFENMNSFARDFIRELLNDGEIRVLDDEVKITAAYGKFDSFVAGCTVNITIEERQPACL